LSSAGRRPDNELDSIQPSFQNIEAVDQVKLLLIGCG